MNFKGIKGEKNRKEAEAQLSEKEKEIISSIIIAAEKELPSQLRKIQGDASEAGLIKFVQPIINLDDVRSTYPTHSFKGTDGKPQDAMIPFSSEIKFNMYIRDMRERKSSDKLNTPLMLVMKGAPERIISRCSKILIEGEEIDINEDILNEIEFMNTSLGKMGERVLAVARYNLEPERYGMDYQFDTKNWKQWKDVLSYDEA